MASLEPVKTWEEPVADFLLHYKATRSQNTHDFYAAQLKTLASWAASQGIAFQDFRPRHLDKFVIYRRESGMKETTIHHGAACAKKFFGWCAKNELADRDYLKDVRVANAPMPPRRVIANADVEKFLATLPDYWDPRKNDNVKRMSSDGRAFHRNRNTAIYRLALCTAARVGELLAIRLEDYIASERRILLRETKGSVPREVPVSLSCQDALAAWLRTRKRVMADLDGEDKGWLFVSELGGRLDTNGFLSLIGPISEFAGCSVRLQMHDLRRFALTNYALDNPHSTAKLAGHKDFRTTQRYAAVSLHDLTALVDRVDVLARVTQSKREPRRRRIV